MTGSKTKQVCKGLSTLSLAIGLAGAALTALPTDADATIFAGSIDVTANTSDPGLIINTLELGGGSFTTPDIIEGDTHSFNLFQIWTNEGDVGADDQVAKPISVQFSFTAPPPAFGGSVEGDTDGIRTLFGFIQYGQVSWDGPLTLNYPGGGNGALKITLSNETFSGGFFGLTGGRGHGATVKATFSNKADPTPVPEPASLAFLGMGLAGFGWATRRRRQPV